MDTEIELKFLVSDNEVPLIPALITQFAKRVNNKPAKNLQNAYYDSPSRELRALDIGLRTRCLDDNCEQTIKLSGEVVGGLHQRPEYNLPLSGNKPDIFAFDSSIWPMGMRLESIAENLYPIFSTNFIRRTWLIETDNGGKIEVVLDKGEIAARGKVDPICELEIELVEGDRADLFDLAEQLLSHIGLRLGFYSKAARGYRLADDLPLIVDKAIGFVPLSDDCTQEQALMATVNYAIEFVQKHEQCYVNEPSLKALKRIIDGVRLIRHAFWLFSDFVAKESTEALKKELKWLLGELQWVESASYLKTYTSKRHAYYKRIHNAPELAHVIGDLKDVQPTPTDLEDLFHCARYNRLILALTRWLLEKSWRQNWDQNAIKAAQSSAKSQAKKSFDSDWKNLRQTFSENKTMLVSEYLNTREILENMLLSGNCFGSLFEASQRHDFRAPWMDIVFGIHELETLHYLKQLCEGQKEQSFTDILSWLQQKADFLVSAMEQSRHASLNCEPYW
ncbi:CYTH and CHAD domain-containing protein [Pseudoalteromonas luteoviolacea]|uniref:Adenylate cyclase n=1 Tax=Pseudoalteromonas luteoviolacea DSM 6061 TaxID=1365250 RepID=A0A166YH07_9GAMM|nr:CYTH and CHAD domain-containing protein [Pseudoalteromonas luteoviolacea]KZN42620.1 adenylate cyclase [Pseudoalteromonas luteoviolacea DSM 6061]MBE0385186.1 triphosphatase [Pseudoalteromonas luteoviolacea DSM 6061]